MTRQLIDKIDDLRQRRNAVILAHNYMTPDIFHGVADIQGDSLALANFLLEKALVVAVPGKPFGMEGHLRLSYAGSAEDASEGMARIRWALDPGAPAEITIGDRKVIRDWL